MLQKNTSQPAMSISQNKEEQVLDVKQVISKFIQNWLLFVISVVVCISLALIYSFYASKSWNIKSKMLVKDDKNNPQGALSGSFSSEIGSVFNAKSNADNEIQILKSRTLMQNTVTSMQLNVRTYLKNGLTVKEIFNESPFIVSLVRKADTLAAVKYDIEVSNDKEFVISDENTDLKKNALFGQMIDLGQYTLTLKFIPGTKYSKNYQIEIADPGATVDGFLKDFTAVLSDKQATTIDLAITYPHPAKGEAILNKLMQLYMSSNLQNEKQIADSTMSFIDSRIVLVLNELNNIEKQFEQYKTQNNLTNINEQSKVLVSSASDYYDKLAQQETQLSIIKDLERYLNNPQNKNIIPSSLINPTDAAFGQAINSYNELMLARDKASLSYTDDNPVIQNLNQQLNNSRLNLLKNIQTYKTSLETGRNVLKQQNKDFSNQLKKIPGKERNYLDFTRQQNLKQELYLFLLQKREETAISRNSTISSSRIIDAAKSDFRPFKPKKSIIVVVGFIVGLILPVIYLLVREMLNVRIETKGDIEAMVNVPILGEIGHNSDKQSLVTGTNSRSVISEQFRSLRTNLQFVLGSSKSNIILFTSSMSGEGKSFLSLNLGSALALTDKKVVFLEMDLRKPKLSESIGLSPENGFTNYAISDDKNYDFSKLLKPLSFNKNCFLISSGPIPPNPSELLMGQKLENLLSYLKANFDYIIIDCAPVGLVTDALMLTKHADLTFYVTRQGFTYKAQLGIINDLVQTNKVENLYIIVNDIKAQKAGYSSYKQAYGYGIEEEQSRWSKIKFWK